MNRCCCVLLIRRGRQDDVKKTAERNRKTSRLFAKDWDSNTSFNAAKYSIIWNCKDRSKGYGLEGDITLEP